MSCPAHDIESSTLTSNYNTDECTISKYQEDPPVLNQVLQRPVKRVFETYIHPRLPIFQSRVIFEVFSDNEAVSQFVAFLRLAIVAVSAPYINQQDIVAAGYKSRHQAISKFYEAAQSRLNEGSTKNLIERIQGALLLSFCARSIDKPTLPNDKYWLDIAVSAARELNFNEASKDTVYGQDQRLLRVIWWTCYMYEKINAFSNAHIEAPIFVLHAKDAQIVTIGDFGMGCTCVSTKENETAHHDFSAHFLSLRLMSIHLKKIWLATLIEELFSSSAYRFLMSKMEAPAPKQGNVLPHDRYLWQTFELESQLAVWQRETGNDNRSIEREAVINPTLAVQWSSFYILFNLVIIGFYHMHRGSMSMRGTTQFMEQQLRQARISFLVEEVMKTVELLFRANAVVLSHVCDPSIFSSLGVVANILADDFAPTKSYKTSQASTFLVTYRRCTYILAKYKTELLHGELTNLKGVHRPVGFTSLPFKGLGLPDTSASYGSDSSGDIDSSPCFGPTPTPGSWSTEEEEMLYNAESILYNP